MKRLKTAVKKNISIHIIAEGKLRKQNQKQKAADLLKME